MTILTLGLMHAYHKKKVRSAAKLNEIKNEYEKLILNTKIEIQEQTLEEISREIHDNIGLSLTLAKLNITTINTNNKVELIDKLEKSTVLLSKAITDLRSLSHSMNSEQIKSNGLINALNGEVARINKATKINIDFAVSGTPSFLDGPNDLIIFRSIQELLNNILKHAQANNIKITTEFNENGTRFNIEDDGVGFNQDQLSNEKGSGLKSIQNRIKQINGSIHILSTISGTKVQLIIPHKK